MRKPALTVQYCRCPVTSLMGIQITSRFPLEKYHAANNDFHLQGSFNPEVFNFINEHVV